MKIAHLNACEMCKVDNNEEVKLLLQHLTSTVFNLTEVNFQLARWRAERVCVCVNNNSSCKVW